MILSRPTSDRDFDRVCIDLHAERVAPSKRGMSVSREKILVIILLLLLILIQSFVICPRIQVLV